MVTHRIGALALCLASIPGPARAEERLPRWTAEGSFSSVQFTESELHLSPGFSVGYRLTPRLEISSDFSYLYACPCDQDLLLLARLTYMLRESASVAPYAVGAGGVLWHRDLVGYGVGGPPGLRPYWSTDPWVSGGFGVRIRMGEGFHVAPEAQIAYPLAVTFGVRLGFRF
jgi:hypothetical protein